MQPNLRIKEAPLVKLYKLGDQSEVYKDKYIGGLTRCWRSKETLAEVFADALACAVGSIEVSRMHFASYQGTRAFTVTWLETVDETVATLDDRERYSRGLCELYKAVVTIDPSEVRFDEEQVGEALDELLGTDDDE